MTNDDIFQAVVFFLVSFFSFAMFVLACELAFWRRK